MLNTTTRTTEEGSAPTEIVGSKRSVLLAFLAGTLVSFAWSWAPSLWTDEAATISAASRSFVDLFAMARTIDVVHTTYYAFMHLWLHVAPADALWLRLPSAFAAGAATAGVLVVGRRLGGDRLGLLAAVVFAVLPRTTWMGAEARPYAMTAVFALAATGVLVLAVQPQRAGGSGASRRQAVLLAAYAVLAALGIALNVYVALLLVSHALTLLLLPGVSWQFRLRWFAAGVAATLLSSPIVWTAAHQTGQLGGGDFSWATWARNVVVNQWYLGETPTLSTGGDVPSGVLSWKLAAVALAVLCWIVVGVGLRRRPSATVVLWAVPWIVVPTVVIGLYSVLVHNMYSARYFTFATAGLALLIAHGLVQLRRDRVVALLLLAVVLIAAPVWVSQRGHYAKSGADWAEAAHFVQKGSSAGEGVYFAPRYPIDSAVVRQTTRGIATAYPTAFRGLVDVTLVESAAQSGDLTGRSALLQATASRWKPLGAVWVVRRNDYAYKAQDDQVLFDAGFRPSARWEGPLDQVIEYKRTPR